MAAFAASPRWLWLLLAPLTVLSVLAIQRVTAPAVDLAPQPPKAAARTIQLPASAPRNYQDALAKADRDLAAYQVRAAQHPDEWMVLEGLARRYSTRARLTGSFDDYAAAQATLDRAFAVARPGAGPHLTQAALHFTMHRLAAAERYLDVIDRYAVPVDIEERAEVAAIRGDIAFYRGDYAGAQARYRQADAMAPGAGTAFRWAVFFTKTGKLDDAERFFDGAVKASRMPLPQFQANVELQKGTLYLERGQWDRALEYFRRADAIFPGFWLIQEHIAETLTLKGERAEAERLYADIVRRTDNPEFMDILAGFARDRGDTAAAQAWFARADAIWQRRLLQFPEAAYGHALSHFVDAGDTARALDIAQRNAAARPYGDPKVLLAEAQLKAGQPETARATIEGVLSTPWNTAQTHGVAAQVYAATGARGLAARERARALAINPHELDDAATPLKAFN